MPCFFAMDWCCCCLDLNPQTACTCVVRMWVLGCSFCFIIIIAFVLPELWCNFNVFICLTLPMCVRTIPAWTQCLVLAWYRHEPGPLPVALTRSCGVQRVGFDPGSGEKIRAQKNLQRCTDIYKVAHSLWRFSADLWPYHPFLDPRRCLASWLSTKSSSSQCRDSFSRQPSVVATLQQSESTEKRSRAASSCISAKG